MIHIPVPYLFYFVLCATPLTAIVIRTKSTWTIMSSDQYRKTALRLKRMDTEIVWTRKVETSHKLTPKNCTLDMALHAMVVSNTV